MMMRMDHENSDSKIFQSEDKDSEGGRVGGPSEKKRSAGKHARFDIPAETSSSRHVEITIDDDAPEQDEQLAAKKTHKEKKPSRAPSIFRRVSTFSRMKPEAAQATKTGTGAASAKHFDRTKSAVTHALKGLNFITTKTGTGAAGWPAVEKRFKDLTASTNGLLHSSFFGQCIGMKDSEEFAEELFHALGRRHNITGDSIDKVQLKAFWEQISDESLHSRLQTFFDVMDKNADGKVTEEEIGEIIRLSASANKLPNIQKQANEYAALIMQELDPDQDGCIMVQDLEELLMLQAPNESASSAGGDGRIQKLLSQKPKPKPKPKQESNPLRRWCQKSKYLVMDKWARLWVMTLWVGIVGGLFAYKFVDYRHKAAFKVMGYCVCTAKGAAETLKFNMALILLPVCRNTITWLRNKTRLGVVVPFDDNINFHKVIAVAIAIGVALHGLAHLTCDFPRLLHATEEEYEPMQPYFGEEQPPHYWWFLKGVEGVTGIIMVVLMAIAFTLATPWFRQNKLKLPVAIKKLTGFNAFWYSHHLFVIVYTLLIVHGVCLYLTKEWYKKTTWMYIAVPVALYACERLIRAFRSTIWHVDIRKVAVYPEKVLTLHMSKPPEFEYRSGQYMFIKCSAVSHFEWHPFSITSAPGEDYLSVHIRALGDWTEQLTTVFSKICQPPDDGGSGPRSIDFSQGAGNFRNNKNIPKISIDGPYGAPAQEYMKYEVVLLVGQGIGATPMIGIVKDIISNTKKKKKKKEEVIKDQQEEEDVQIKVDHQTTITTTDHDNGSSGKKKKEKSSSSSSRSNYFKTMKAYYYWVTREQGSFEWFKGIMNEVGEKDEKGVIEMHNYCTSVFEEGDARSVLITMLQSLHHAKNGVDVVSGTPLKSHFARPKWRHIFNRIASQHPHNRVGVFYCGGPGLGEELRQLSSEFSHETTTIFDFHKENF